MTCLPRFDKNAHTIVSISLSGFIGDPSDGIGYIDLSGFANDAGREVRYAIRALQHGSSQLAASDSDVRDDAGLVATDPTKLKVSCMPVRNLCLIELYSHG
jgi:hypothetical protein